MENTIVKQNQVHWKCCQTVIFPVTEEVSETEREISRNGFLKKLDAFSTWVICTLLPKSLTSGSPPDRQIYY